MSFEKTVDPQCAEGLDRKLRSYARQFRLHTGVDVMVAATDSRSPLPPRAESAVLKIVQEALENTHLHSGTSHAYIDLACTDSIVACDVIDDGCGFDLAAIENSARSIPGLRTMRERAAQLGGYLTLSSAPGSGTTVSLRIPVYS